METRVIRADRRFARRMQMVVPLAAVVVMSAASPEAQTRRTPTPPPPTIAELVGLVETQAHVLEEQARVLEQQKQALDDQKRTLEEQQREIERLRELLEEMQKLSVANSNRLDEMARTPQAPSVDEAVEERLAKIEQAVTQIPDLPTDVVAAGQFPGSIAVPGTDAAFRLGGLVRTTAVGSLGPLGTEDRFVTSSIPVEGTSAAGKESRFVMSVVPSRFNVDVRTPTGVGAMRAFIEGDFAGASSSLRLRHGYGQWKGVLVGQTWSTFADPDAEPDGIDFEGLNAIALFRQTQFRYTRPIRQGLDVAFALENPAPDITDAKGVSQVPDVIVRFRWRPRAGALGLKMFRRDSHVNLALLARRIRGEPFDQVNTTYSTNGFGVGLSGRVGSHWQPDRNQVLFAAYAGSGIGRYITDLGTLHGQDAVFDTASNTLEALPVFAWYLGYETRWNQKWRSTFTYGTVLVNNLDVQVADALNQTNRSSVNLTWSPIGRLDLVGEFLFGNRINKSGQHGASSQFQLGTNFRF